MSLSNVTILMKLRALVPTYYVVMEACAAQVKAMHPHMTDQPPTCHIGDVAGSSVREFLTSVLCGDC